MARSIKFNGWAWKNAERQFQRELMSNSDKVNRAAINILYEAQRAFVDSLPSEETNYMPVITGNLHDSIVSVVSHKGRVLRASYTAPIATTASLITGKEIFAPTAGFGRKRIVGQTSARTAVRNLQGKYPGGLTATMMITVPYAENPNAFSETNKKGEHVGYIDVLASKYYKSMERGFKLYDYYDLFKWKGAPISWETPILK